MSFRTASVAFIAVGSVAGVIGLAHLIDGDLRWAALQAANVGLCVFMAQRCADWGLEEQEARRRAEEAET